MNLIINKVMQFEIVHISDGYGIVKAVARSAVAKEGFAIDNLEFIVDTVTNFVKENTKETMSDDSYKIFFKTSGGKESSLGVIIDVVGKTQEIADTVCALARSRMLHCDYNGRKSSAGNLAFTFSPSDIHVGEVYEFSVFHLAKVDSLMETSETLIEEV